MPRSPSPIRSVDTTFYSHFVERLPRCGHKEQWRCSFLRLRSHQMIPDIFHSIAQCLITHHAIIATVTCDECAARFYATIEFGSYEKRIRWGFYDFYIENLREDGVSIPMLIVDNLFNGMEGSGYSVLLFNCQVWGTKLYDKVMPYNMINVNDCGHDSRRNVKTLILKGRNKLSSVVVEATCTYCNGPITLTFTFTEQGRKIFRGEFQQCETLGMKRVSMTMQEVEKQFKNIAHILYRFGSWDEPAFAQHFYSKF